MHRQRRRPRSCDLGLVVATVAGEVNGVGVGGGGIGVWAVWLVDDTEAVVVRTARSLPSAVDTARAYCAAWGARVQHIETPGGELLHRSVWEPLVSAPGPLPYVWTVELRSPRSAGRHEMVAALWTTPDLEEATRWRELLPAALRSRVLIVSDAPMGITAHSRPPPPATWPAPIPRPMPRTCAFEPPDPRR